MCEVLKPFYFLVILVLTNCQYSFGQTPEDTTKDGLYAQGNTGKTPILDSVKYIPRPRGWTNDFVDIFSKTEEESLDSLIGNYEKKTSTEIAVVTINSEMMGPLDLESYSLLMLRTWGVGKKEKNNGILIVIAPDINKIRIENGYGIERVLSNEETKEVIDKVIVPYFKKDKFYEGTKAGINALMFRLGTHSK
jgi:uncharacterized protein